jgi:hypothetical protein
MSYKRQTGEGQRHELNCAVNNADFNPMLWKTRRMQPVSCIRQNPILCSGGEQTPGWCRLVGGGIDAIRLHVVPLRRPIT